MTARVPENEQVPAAELPAVRVTGVKHVAASCPAPVGPVMVLDIARAPAKPLVAGGLPRLVQVSETPADPPEAKDTLVELGTTLKPLTLIVGLVEGESLLARLVVAIEILAAASQVFG